MRVAIRNKGLATHSREATDHRKFAAYLWQQLDCGEKAQEHNRTHEWKLHCVGLGHCDGLVLLVFGDWLNGPAGKREWKARDV